MLGDADTGHLDFPPGHGKRTLLALTEGGNRSEPKSTSQKQTVARKSSLLTAGVKNQEMGP